MIRTFSIVAALLLAACHAPSDNAAGANMTLAPNTNPIPGIPAVRPPSRSEIAKQARMIPTALQGRWGINPSDCDISRSDTKGLLVIHSDTLDFYESKAKVDALSRASQEDVTLDLTFTGEGQTWKRREVLRTAMGGTRLLRTEQSPEKTFRYVRCQ